MKRFLYHGSYLVVGVLIALLIGPALEAHPATTSQTENAAITKVKNRKCNKACQGTNDFFFGATDYDDYFVNDSDGHKDMVFSVYKNVPLLEGVRCTIVKNDSGSNYAIAGIVCPPSAAVIIPPSLVTQEDNG